MSELSAEDREGLDALGYAEGWLESGLLDRALLASQLERLRSGGTKKTGRYRAQAAAAWLGAAGPLEDGAIDAFLSLMDADPDAKMARAAVADLIQSPRLTLPQLDRIAQAHPELLRRHEALIRRTYLARRLEDGVTDELLARVIELQDAAIQTGLIHDPRLTRRQAEQLAAQGANPTIRANAQSWLQDKKAWK